MLDEQGTAIRGLVTDVTLGSPELTGWDIARRAREQDPKMPIIYTTAESADRWAAMGVPDSILIQKPYATAQITTAISQLLNTATP
ncbi:hypothetical protein [Mesorhizobium sp. WSM2240]